MWLIHSNEGETDMALKVPDVGELELLDLMLKEATTADEKYELKLYKNNITPADTDNTSSFTPATFTNYVTKTLSRAGWNTAVTNGSDKAETSYGSTPQSWTCGATGNTIYGYYVEGSTSNKLLWAERFATQRVLASGDVLNITPKFTLSTES